MRARFDSEYIEGELERIGDAIETPLTVYLIGGGAMAFRDLKDTTKDINPRACPLVGSLDSIRRSSRNRSVGVQSMSSVVSAVLSFLSVV